MSSRIKAFAFETSIDRSSPCHIFFSYFHFCYLYASFLFWLSQTHTHMLFHRFFFQHESFHEMQSIILTVCMLDVKPNVV